MKERPTLMNTEMVKAILEERKTQTRRVIKPQPKYTCSPRNFDAEVGDKVIYMGWPCYLRESKGRNKRDAGELTPHRIPCPYGQPGDRLWVREKALYWTGGASGTSDVVYQDDPMWGEYLFDAAVFDKATVISLPKDVGNWRIRPSIHMPRWASRITLEITNVRVERVQETTAFDALSEGINIPVPSGCDIPDPPKEWKGWSKGKRDEWVCGQARTTYFTRCADAQNHIDAFRELWDSINAKRGYGWDINPWVWVIEFKRV